MIIKSKTRKSGSFRQLLSYMILGEERVSESRIILHNLMGQNLEDWVTEFQANENRRKRKRKNSVKLYHEILAWHPDDTEYLSLDTIEDLTRTYIEHRNPNGLYVGAVHLSQDHYHVHLCISGVEYGSGKPLRISREKFKTLKQQVQSLEMERYPELHYSQVSHGKPRENQPVKEGKYFSLREQVLAISQSASSAQDFLEKLTANQLAVYYRRGKPQGILYKGKRHRFRTLGLSPEQVNYLARHLELHK